MKYATTFTIAAIALVCGTSAASSPPVTFESPCSCRDNHGQHRWSVKINPSLSPGDANAIQAVTPSDIYSWPGPDVPLTQQSERTGIENNWYALTGRVVALKVEADGDLHIGLQDATGDKAGIVVCEIPAKQQWCSIRETVFSWTTTRFPFHTNSSKKLTLDQTPVVTVIGKAFFDVGHSLKDQKSNRRSHLPGYSAWEIHPVMTYAKKLISEGHVVVDRKGAWAKDRPSTELENEFIRVHGFSEYAKWHLGIDDRYAENAKGRYKFPYGDFKNVHRCGVLAAQIRAGEYRYSEIENAAAQLRALVEATRNAAPSGE